MKKITFKILFCFTLLSTVIGKAQCLTAIHGEYPLGTYNSTTACDGITPANITTLAYASEYSTVSVTAGETYSFRSSIATDYITISADAGTTAVASGVTPLTWVATATGTVRFYTHADALCGDSTAFRTRSFVCGVPPCIQPTVTFGKTSNCPALDSFNATANITNLILV